MVPRFDRRTSATRLPLLASGSPTSGRGAGFRAGRPIGWALAFILGAFFLARYGRSVGPASPGSRRDPGMCPRCRTSAAWLSPVSTKAGCATKGEDRLLRGERPTPDPDDVPRRSLSPERRPEPDAVRLSARHRVRIDRASPRARRAGERCDRVGVPFAPAAGESQRPRDLERFIQTRMVPVSDLGPCTLYGHRGQ